MCDRRFSVLYRHLQIWQQFFKVLSLPKSYCCNALGIAFILNFNSREVNRLNQFRIQYKFGRKEINKVQWPVRCKFNINYTLCKGHSGRNINSLLIEWMWLVENINCKILPFLEVVILVFLYRKFFQYLFDICQKGCITKNRLFNINFQGFQGHQKLLKYIWRNNWEQIQ